MSMTVSRKKTSGDKPEKQNFRVEVLDTTLRDGQQCPGAGMSFEKNLQYADLAARLGIDILEAGFSSASEKEYKIVHGIAERYASKPDSPKVAAICQLREDQFDITISSLEPATEIGKSRLHTYLPVDPRLMRSSLGEQNSANKLALVEKLHRLVSKAVKEGVEVQFSPEGYSRLEDNFDFVTDCIRAVISAGATVINCPDTIGGASRMQGDAYFVEYMKRHAEIVKKEFPNKDIVWSAHCHNDLGLAVENTMTAVFEGPALQIEGCINGIGERAGNVSLEQCFMFLDQFGSMPHSDKSYYVDIDYKRIQEVSDFVDENMLPRQPHWPVTGINAARHSSGGHTNAVLKDPMAYQPFHPEIIGKRIQLIFGPSSGGNHAKSVIEEHGFTCTHEEKAEIAQFIKGHYAYRYKGITDEELISAYQIYRNSETDQESV